VEDSANGGMGTSPSVRAPSRLVRVEAVFWWTVRARRFFFKQAGHYNDIS
jgi:hypothetical protein